jgi:hypothetical protein
MINFKKFIPTIDYETKTSSLYKWSKKYRYSNTITYDISYAISKGTYRTQTDYGPRNPYVTGGVMANYGGQITVASNKTRILINNKPVTTWIETIWHPLTGDYVGACNNNI